ncbi:MAG: TM2 domain-containing protein [Victivallaceae bacterium]|nr:TM2 domain-containing protein [Victivallaceae bacterium]
MKYICKCGAEFDVPSEYVGQNVQCSVCKEIFIPTATVTPINKDEKECQFCSELIKYHAKKCKHCGSTVDVMLNMLENQQQKQIQLVTVQQPALGISPFSLNMYQILAFFFGALGIHNFVVKRYSIAIIQLVLSIISFGYLVFFVWIWAFVEIFTVRKDGNGLKIQ